MIEGAVENPNRGDVPARSQPSISFADYATVHLGLVPALLFAAAWVLQHRALDMTLASAFFDPISGGFPWRTSPWLDIVGHHAARSLRPSSRPLASQRGRWLTPSRSCARGAPSC
ncbi:MAG: hypothetical protein M3R22_08805 [Pseudomonadota bacterium]|nr:hypothetical protein [Pseudomonadota bacterium]